MWIISSMITVHKGHNLLVVVRSLCYYFLGVFDTFYKFLGTSGQNTDYLDKYSEAESKLDFVERTLRWRHLAPTA